MQEADPQTPFSLTVVSPPNSFFFLNVVCRCSSTVEHLICNQDVASSILAIGLASAKIFRDKESKGERFPSGQREQTVNLPAYAFGGSNPPLSTSQIFMYDSKIDVGRAGVAQLVEREPSKLGVAGSSPVSRSSFFDESNFFSELNRAASLLGVVLSIVQVECIARMPM